MSSNMVAKPAEPEPIQLFHMNRNHFWKLLLIILVIVWSVAEFTPLTNRDLIQIFRANAVKRDETLNQIGRRAQDMQKTNSARAYGNLLEAIGTNDIVP